MRHLRGAALVRFDGKAGGGSQDAGRGAWVTMTDGRGTMSAPPRGLRVLRENESEVPGVRCHPFSLKSWEGRLCLHVPLHPWQSQAGTPWGGRDGVFSCLEGLVEWVLAFLLPLYPAARLPPGS